MAMEKQRPGAKARPGELSTFGGVGSDNTREQRGRQRKTVTVALAVVHDPETGDQSIPVQGRILWALRHLIAAGETGCTPIDTPGPRWSDYIFKLRRAGIAVETIHEPHGPPFSGTHGRYILRSKVTLREPAKLRGWRHDLGHALRLVCGQRRRDRH